MIGVGIHVAEYKHSVVRAVFMLLSTRLRMIDAGENTVQVFIFTESSLRTTVYEKVMGERRRLSREGVSVARKE